MWEEQLGKLFLYFTSQSQLLSLTNKAGGSILAWQCATMRAYLYGILIYSNVNKMSLLHMRTDGSGEGKLMC